jgi:hypothetical protein
MDYKLPINLCGGSRVNILLLKSLYLHKKNLLCVSLYYYPKSIRDIRSRE